MGIPNSQDKDKKIKNKIKIFFFLDLKIEKLKFLKFLDLKI